MANIINIDYKKELNKEQFKVVTKGAGFSLVLAGAGSGKTRTLVYRVAYLIEQGVLPENILLVTFTNKASTEMLERVEDLLQNKVSTLKGGTFHHMANLILRKYAPALGYGSDFTILDQEDSKHFLKGCCSELGIESKNKMFPKVNVIRSMFSFALNSYKDVEKIINKKYSHLPPLVIEKLVDLFILYQKKKKVRNVMDFDDLLFNWYLLLRDFPDIRKKLSQQFKYILVDEYQDTNVIQDEIIHLLGECHGNILVVGDDAQSIYSFRAANVANILNFGEKHKNSQVFYLDTNYRSTPEILCLANASILNNSDQYEKALKSVKEKGGKPALVPLKDNYEQADFVCKQVNAVIDKGEYLKDSVVLFRASYQILELELELNKRGILYIVRGGMRFFEQAHIKDVVSFIKIIANTKDEVAWKRVLTMFEGIGVNTAEKIYKELERAEYSQGAPVSSGNNTELIKVLTEIKVGKRCEKSIGKLKLMLEELFVAKDLAEAIMVILKRGYEQYLKNTFENYKDRMKDLEQLADFASKYIDKDNQGTIIDEGSGINSFLTEIALSENFKKDDKSTENQENVLVLSTIHQAKGLEWKNVFVIGLAQGQFPHYKSLESREELSEERRLFYVAVTRAKENLYCLFPVSSMSAMTGYRINSPSVFLTEIDEDLFKKWKIKGGDISMFEKERKPSFISKKKSKNRDNIDGVDEDFLENEIMGTSILDKVSASNKNKNDFGDGSFFKEDVIEYD